MIEELRRSEVLDSSVGYMVTASTRPRPGLKSFKNGAGILKVEDCKCVKNSFVSLTLMVNSVSETMQVLDAFRNCGRNHGSRARKFNLGLEVLPQGCGDHFGIVLRR